MRSLPNTYLMCKLKNFLLKPYEIQHIIIQQMSWEVKQRENNAQNLTSRSRQKKVSKSISMTNFVQDYFHQGIILPFPTTEGLHGSCISISLVVYSSIKYVNLIQDGSFRVWSWMRKRQKDIISLKSVLRTDMKLRTVIAYLKKNS